MKWLVGLVVVVVGGAVPLSAGASSVPTSSVSATWVEPAAGYGFLDRAIDAATRTIDVSMYELSDPTVEDDLLAKARDGVIVDVLLDAAYYGQSDNAAAYATLHAGGVHVEWAPASQIFHAKYVVIDARTAYVGTGNLDARDYPSTRDFWVEDRGAGDVRAIVATFDGDFGRRAHQATDVNGLVWSPGSSGALVRLIAAARSSLLVENEEMDNTTVEEALEAAARRGVVVKVVMTYSSEWTSALTHLERAGVKVVTLDSSPLYIHAKVICVDCTAHGGEVFIGSENFSTASLSYNRELGVVTSTRGAVRDVETAVNADYAAGRPG